MDFGVNVVAIIVAVIVNMAVGFLWYSPIILGKPWMKERGFTKEKMKSMQKEAAKSYGMSAIAALLMAYVLYHVMALSFNTYNYSAVQTGLTSGFFMWLGFVMPTQFTTTIFSDKKNWTLFGIDTGYQLVALLGMGVAIGLLS